MVGHAEQQVPPGLHAAAPHPIDADAVWAWLHDVPDPEIPVVSVVDLGIVRDVEFSAKGECIVTVTPTYSGCPATEVIGALIREALLAHGLEHVELRVQLSPAWTTDWLTAAARYKLRAYGIAPPMGRAEPSAAAEANATGAAQGFLVLGQDLLEPAPSAVPACPRCGSARSERISQFGSTPCKSLHRCLACLEPFDYFKCH